jgi:hypothetical protein
MRPRNPFAERVAFPLAKGIGEGLPLGRLMPKSLDIETERLCPDNMSQNRVGASRKLVPIAKSRFVLLRRFWGYSEESGVHT